MKLKEKLAFNYAETVLNMYGPNDVRVIAAKAFLAGFKKATEMAKDACEE